MDALATLLHAAQAPALPPPMLKPVSVGDVLTNPAPPPAFVWDGYLPRGVVALLGAHGGTGKSTIALMLGVCAALGRPLFGVDTGSMQNPICEPRGWRAYREAPPGWYLPPLGN